MFVNNSNSAWRLPLLTNPNADADGCSNSWRAPSQGSKWKDSHIPPVHAHGRQGDAGRLHRDLWSQTKEFLCNTFHYFADFTLLTFLST